MRAFREFVVTLLKCIAVVFILLALLFTPDLPDLIPAPHWLNTVLDIVAGLFTLSVMKWIVERPSNRERSRI
jgi:hypothetical protein